MLHQYSQCALYSVYSFCRHEKMCKSANLVCGQLLWIIVDISNPQIMDCGQIWTFLMSARKSRKNSPKWLVNNKNRLVLNYFMHFDLFLINILLNCLSFTAKSVDISNSQNLVCGQIWTFLKSDCSLHIF